jgi:hypothetical protein
MLLLLYPQGKEQGCQSQSGLFREEKNLLALPDYLVAKSLYGICYLISMGKFGKVQVQTC